MFKQKWYNEFPFHLMLIPGVIVVFIYSYIPMVGVIMAFQRFIPTQGFFGSPLIGLEHFRYVFTLNDTLHVIYNTVFIAVMKIIAGMIMPIIFALLLNEISQQFFKRTFQTLVYLPHFLSWVILGSILIDILSPSSGIVNQVLGLFGVKPIFFLGSNKWFPFVLVVSDVWKEFGFGTIIYLAALTGINPSLYEAGRIDGASRIQQTLHISLPGMLPIIILMGTLSLGSILNAGFDQVFNLYSPIVYQRGDILDTFIYRIGLENAQYGVATAVGLFKSVISTIFIVSSYYLAYRVANYRIF